MYIKKEKKEEKTINRACIQKIKFKRRRHNRAQGLKSMYSPAGKCQENQ